MLACFIMIVDTISDLFSKSQTQIFLEFQRIKAFQIFHQGIFMLASPSKDFPT